MTSSLEATAPAERQRRLSPATLLIALCTLAPLAQAQAPAAACTLTPIAGETRELTSGGRKRSYRLFVPPAVAGQQRLPLVLDLHGTGGNSSVRARDSGFEALAAREGFAVATLQAEDSRWNVPVATWRADDVQYVSDVIDDIAARSCIAPERVYATGFSGGGRMSSLLGCRLNHRRSTTHVWRDAQSGGSNHIGMREAAGKADPADIRLVDVKGARIDPVILIRTLR